MNNRIIAIILLCLIISLCIYINRPIKGLKGDKVIFTCTTFFDFEKQDKWKCFTRAIDSIIKNNDKKMLDQIDVWIVINEYAEKPKKNWSKMVSERYPFIRFIQKKRSQRGQAKSMNLILKEIKKYKYWIHWEESWYCRNECIGRMLDVIKNTNVTQLQVTYQNNTTSWMDISEEYQVHKKTKNNTEYVIILPTKNEENYKLDLPLGHPDFRGEWPLYSLQPSINKVELYIKTGKFNENPKYWPITFELDFAKRLYKNGMIKAVLPDGPVTREKTHTSTYYKIVKY